MKPIPRISDAEWEVMKVFWRRGPCTAQIVIDDLADSKHWRTPTIKTLLNRLLRKGALSFEKKGRAYVYSPTVSEAESRGTAAVSFLDRFFDGALSPFLAHFTSTGKKLRPEEAAELEKILKVSRKKP
jgi:BlaI family transcriptional regulator, penicillinase repressor